jgi:uncharacterized membrane protein
MFELISLISVILAIAALSSARGTRTRLENELADVRLELQRLQAQATGQPLAGPDAADTIGEQAAEPAVEAPAAETAADIGATDSAAREEIADAPEPEAATATEPARESFESMLAARWTVWVGGLALAFAGIFAVKYSIDQGLLSPAVRLSLAAIFGLVLVGIGEWVRRRSTPLLQNRFQNALIPGILTAAGSLTLMGVVFVSHAFYGYFGPAVAFLLLAMISLATLALSLLHGQALAGLGLVASFVTPALVSSEDPSPWSLFGYLSIAWIGAILASRLRGWRVAPPIANAGLSIWAILYIVASTPFEGAPVTLSLLIMIAGLAFLWPGRWIAADEAPVATDADEATEPKAADQPADVDAVSGADAVKTADPWQQLLLPRHLASTLVAGLGVMAAAASIVSPDSTSTGHAVWYYAALVAAMALFGAFRAYAIYPAALAALTALAGFRIMSFGAASIGFNAGVEGSFVPALDPLTAIRAALGFGLFFAALGIAVAWRQQARSPHTIAWTIISAVAALLLGGLSFIVFGNYDFDPMHGVYALVIGAAWLGAAQVAIRDADADGRFLLARDVFVAASWAAFAGAIAVMTNGVVTTVGIALLGFAYLLGRRVRGWPVLPWAMVASALVVAGRIAWQPTIVGATALGTTPVFNALLVGYGIPAVLLIAAAWLMRKDDDRRLRSVLEALASLFTLLTIAILVRHAMNGGVLDASEPSLSEVSIYTLLTIGASATLMALDLRQPSIVFRFGSMAVGYVSMVSVVAAHYVGLNPYFTSETTGSIPVFNLLFLAYLLPGLAYGGAAWFARGRRPQHYVVALALTGASLLFAYVSLSVRRLYHGADISEWKGFLQAELYTYSVVWLLLGVGLLAAGYRFRAKSIRISAAVLVLIAVVKVFLVDMNNLEGLLRVLSFIGLGLVLIGIGRFYQTILSGLAGDAVPREAGAATSTSPGAEAAAPPGSGEAPQ